MAAERNFNSMYLNETLEAKRIPAATMVKGKFYSLLHYVTVGGLKQATSKRDSAIIFALFVSKSKDIVHCIKVSNVAPSIIKRFFGRLVNMDTREIELSGTARRTYQTVVSKFPGIQDGAYRTYKLSGIKNVQELEMNVKFITHRKDKVTDINPRFQTQNK
jgi:hypothetical protein